MMTDTRERILAYIKEKNDVQPKDIINFIGFSAPAVFRQLKKLQERGLIQKSGSPPRVFYHLPMDKNENKIDNVSGTFIVRFNLFQFGDFLTVRSHARQALLAVNEFLSKIGDWKGKIEIDFTGVKVLGPWWADEFLSTLIHKYPGQVILLPSDNPTVKASLEFVNKK